METGNRKQETGMRWGRDIAERLLVFGVEVVRMTERLPAKPTGRHVALQLLRSATGAGANYEEARAAESRADFVHKLAVAAKEAREAAYWLGLTQRCGWLDEDLAKLTREASELAAILGASARTARARAKGEKE
jgi:four helix bundle protein